MQANDRRGGGRLLDESNGKSGAGGDLGGRVALMVGSSRESFIQGKVAVE